MEDLKPFVKQSLKIAFQEDIDLLNMNFPKNPRGFMWNRQSIRHYDGQMVPGEDPKGRKQYWFTVVPIENPRKGQIVGRLSIAGIPSLHCVWTDLTYHEALEDISNKEVPSTV
ncbi:hypothetical protein [Catalinimonas niigatensis]|uniref:hypothetical protein n=1 Tax=Catalinimonas niigatensis TaxID=1397264 RepID=UPI0026658692|nr:hypothetical protein [Catalinimonas niigatensis]WPP50403.1 hypothetical protein PZB72_27430 [Catalinimonas niigatensis]